MGFVKKIIRFIAEYFIFVAGYLFIFVIGLMYAYIRPQGILFNVIFLVIAIGWTIFILKNFWDILDKHKKDNSSKEKVTGGK